MSTADVKAAAASKGGEGASHVAKKVVDWSSVLPLEVDFEDSVTAFPVETIWKKIYAAAGATDESKWQAIRLAVYVYAAYNGTSREGNYAGKIKPSTGVAFPASVIPLATTRHGIRRFFRSQAEESYDALKQSGALEKSEKMIARAADQGVPLDAIVAMCDWMSGCPKLTPQEQNHNKRLFAVKRDAATLDRHGSLESVEQGRLVEAEVSGPASEGTGNSVQGRAVW